MFLINKLPRFNLLSILFLTHFGIGSVAQELSRFLISVSLLMKSIHNRRRVDLFECIILFTFTSEFICVRTVINHTFCFHFGSSIENLISFWWKKITDLKVYISWLKNRWCKVLPSPSVHHPSTIHFLILTSETTGPNCVLEWLINIYNANFLNNLHLHVQIEIYFQQDYIFWAKLSFLITKLYFAYTSLLWTVVEIFPSAGPFLTLSVF